jgi:ribulose-5-phosphate 4-epimerase/fuculose-1-phosphate aldolase
MYNLGWVTGTGGGISIKLDDEIYIAPSGVQKERIQIDDIFIQVFLFNPSLTDGNTIFEYP